MLTPHVHALTHPSDYHTPLESALIQMAHAHLDTIGTDGINWQMYRWQVCELAKRAEDAERNDQRNVERCAHYRDMYRRAKTAKFRRQLRDGIAMHGCDRE